jgi:circadian clock protein KaiB
MSEAGRKVHLRLRLYVAGQGDYTNRARQNLATLAAVAGFEYELELVDLRSEPGKAAADAVVVTPTLVKLSPLPRAVVIGDLSDRRKLAAALGVSALEADRPCRDPIPGFDAP